MAGDLAFGEFAFSSFRPSHPLAALDSRSNGLNPVADDDEWGDFVKSPMQSQFADPPINSFTGKGNSPLAPTPRWMKPSGALPLSFFGAAEEEEEREGKDAADFILGRSNVSAANFNSVFTENNASKSKNLGAGNMFSHTSQINGENGPDSKSADRFNFIKKDLVLVDNGFHSNSDLNVARSDSTGSKNIHIDGTVERSYQSQLSKNGNNEFSFEANVSDPDHKYDLFGTWSLDLNESSSNPNVKTSGPNLDMNDHMRSLTAHASSPPDDDGDDDGWEFQDAHSEPNTVDLSDKADFTPHDVSAINALLPGSVSSSNEIRNLFEPAKESIDLFAASTRFVDTLASSTAGSHGSQDVEVISAQPSKVSNYDSNIKENETEDILNPSQDVESSDFDDDFGEFTAASAETKPEQVRKDTNFNFHRSALPMSIFGNEEPENDDFLDAQDAFVHQSNSESDNHTSKSVISISDLISSLYNQTEKASSLNTTQEPITFELNLSSSTTSSNLRNPNDGDHLDDTSWDFKDVFSERSGDSEASLYNFGDARLRTSFKMKLNNHLDFYSKLKEVLCFVSKNHIKHLKQSQGNDALLGEHASIVDLTSEFQAEKDLNSAMELIRHTSSMLKILTLGTSEEKTAYISVWSDIITVCAQELKEGASIWTKATEKHIQSQLLAETQGRNFVLELGEIYRVVVILGASTKLFKPWTISCSLDLSSIYILLEGCHAMWSTSGLEEALSSVQVSIASEDTLLFKSIKDICVLDATALQNYVFMEKDSSCSLSMLPAGVAPGVKIIKWGEERYFVTIANLWGNLISRTPPKLPRLSFGS
ncbi:uncharacterized protein [Primulina huaijiensis]|uniref:uncharacterized protein isoform X3 n=1 Tax=Primulina huaijiensis TaxID=1492673 RepID=UPI003CC7089C